MIRLRGFIFLVFTPVLLFGMTPTQLHAADWTKVKMTSENVKQLAGLKFASKVHSISEAGIYDDPYPPRLSISGDGKTARIRGGGGNRRPYRFESQVGARDGMLVMTLWNKIRLFTVERNDAGKFRLSTKYGRHFRHQHRGNIYADVTIVFTQE